jgi:hypothetical protein
MAVRKKSPVAVHRDRKQWQDFVRVEVTIRKDDVSLVRAVASAYPIPRAGTKRVSFWGSVLPKRRR